MRKLILGMTEHPALTISLCLLAAFVILNLLAYRHAWIMTHLAASGGRARSAEALREHRRPASVLERVQLIVGSRTMQRPIEPMRPDVLDLPCEVHTVVGDIGRLAAWHLPRNEAAGVVVLFHGYSDDKSRLLPEARAFHELGYACFLVDFRGSGESDGDGTSIGYHEADDVARTVAHVRERWPDQRLIVFGHSMGAAAVLRALSLRAIAPDAAVLACPFDRLLSTVEARFAAASMPSFPAAQLLVFWGGVQHGFNPFRHNPVEYARAATCPVLLLYGTEDIRVSRDQIEAVYHSLPGDKRLHIFEGADHYSLLHGRVEEWKTCIADFLSSHVTAY
jgi:alpha-beta hydrolase superfamily lysophospholipase